MNNDRSSPGMGVFLLRGEITDRNLLDGKLLIMTPIDPVFLLIPLLATVEFVSLGVSSPLPLCNFQMQSDKSFGNFRPIEDIFEDIAAKICTNGLYQPEDIILLSTLDSVREAFERLTDRKGERFPSFYFYGLQFKQQYSYFQ